MVTGPDQQELLQSIQRVNLLENNPFYLEPKIELPASQIAATKWAEMLQQTGSDYKERAVVVSSFHGNLTTSRIFIGDEKSITTPFLPHGIKSLWPFVRYVTHVHSHPMPEKLNHLQTTLISDGDIRTFRNLSFKAMVMIDHGGAHLLLHTYLADTEKPLPGFNLSNTALDKAKASGNTAKEAMQELANILHPHGIRYYYSPNLEPTNDYIQFTDARNILPPKWE